MCGRWTRGTQFVSLWLKRWWSVNVLFVFSVAVSNNGMYCLRSCFLTLKVNYCACVFRLFALVEFFCNVKFIDWFACNTRWNSAYFIELAYCPVCLVNNITCPVCPVCLVNNLSRLSRHVLGWPIYMATSGFSGKAGYFSSILHFTHHLFPQFTIPHFTFHLQQLTVLRKTQ